MGALRLILGFVVVSMALSMAAFVFVWSRFSRRNAVGRRARRRAPLTWLISPRRHAQLHRRLRNGVRCLRATVGYPGRRTPRTPWLELADDIENEAFAIDADLVSTRRLAGRGRLGFEARVQDVEAMVRRVVVSVQESRRPLWPAPNTVERVDTFVAAHDELSSL